MNPGERRPDTIAGLLWSSGPVIRTLPYGTLLYGCSEARTLTPDSVAEKVLSRRFEVRRMVSQAILPFSTLTSVGRARCCQWGVLGSEAGSRAGCRGAESDGRGL